MSRHHEEKPNRNRTPKAPVAAIQRTFQSAALRCSRLVQAKLNDGPAHDKGKENRRRITLWTVGHSTRSVSDFIALLQAHSIRQLVDVRTIPRSRHNPQFNRDQLPESLKQGGIHYLHMSALGGLRHAHRDSVNTAWRNTSFRGFADYMQTAEFDAALAKLTRLARRCRTAIMCAEAVPWRCHRSLIADALLVRGVRVEEVISETITRPHALTPWARVVGERVTYPSVPAHSDTEGGKIDTQDRDVKS